MSRWKDTTITNSFNNVIGFHDCGESKIVSSEKTSLITFVKTTIARLFVFSNPAVRSRYLAEEAMFISNEGRYDRHYDFHRRLHLDTTTSTPAEAHTGTNRTSDDIDVPFRHKILVVRTGLSDITWASQVWFWVASVLGLTVPYRMWFSNHCRPAELTVTKLIDK